MRGKLAPWALAASLAAFVLAGRYPAMGDLPMHEGMAALLAHRGDPTWVPPGLYQTNLGHPQQLFQVVLAAFVTMMPTALATRLLVAATLAAAPIAMARLLRHADRTVWAMLLVVPLFVGWTYSWGFVSNLLALVLFIAALPTLDRLAEAPTAWRALAATALVLLVFAAHALVAVAAVITLVVLVAAHRPGRRHLPAALPVAVLLGALAVERWREAAIATPIAASWASRTLWHPLVSKATQLPGFLVGRHPPPLRWSLAFLTIAALVSFALARRRGRLVENRFALAAGVLFALYVVSPYSINYGAFLYERFFGPAWIAAVVAAAPTRATRTSIVLALGSAIAVVAAASPQIAIADAQHRALAALFPRVERASAIAVVHYGSRDHSALFDPTSAGSRVLAERGGRLLQSFAEYPTAPIVVTPEKRWDELTFRVATDPGALVPTRDLDLLRYVLVHVRDPDLARLVEIGMVPDARLVAREGEWSLFESTHAGPVDAPAPPADGARAESLQERVHRAATPALR